MLSFSLFNEILTYVAFLNLAIVLLLAVRRHVIAHLGVNVMYVLWSMLPMSLLVFLLPAPWQEVQLAQPIESMVISTSSVVRQYSTNSWWQFIWLSGIFIGLMFSAGQHYRLLYRLNLVPVGKQGSVCLQHRVNHLPTFFSANIKSPILIGIVSPKLVLPNNFEKALPKHHQQMIIEHELCHFQRRDNLWNTLAFILVLCFWFTPLVWLAYRYFRRDQELACDAQVLANKTEFMRVEYSKALLAVAISEQQLPQSTLAFNLYSTQHQLIERVKQIKHNQVPTKIALSLVVLSLLASLLSLSFIGKVYSDHRIEQGFKLAVVTRISPKYPLNAAQNRVEGYVKLTYDVDHEGYVSKVRVIEANPKNTFEQNAVKALEKWRFESVGFKVTKQMLQMDFVMD